MARTLKLGIQSNLGDEAQEAFYKANRWANPGEITFNLHPINATDYHGIPQRFRTGYGNFSVTYFRNKKGQFIVNRDVNGYDKFEELIHLVEFREPLPPQTT